MQELHTLESIFHNVLRAARESGEERIIGVHLAVGELSDHTEESVLAGWNELSKGTMAEEAKLHFRMVQAEVQCMACFTKYHPKDGHIVCPVCGGVGARILAGEEFFLESVDVQ